MKRVIVILLLLSLLFGSAVKFAAISPDPNKGRYPGVEAIGERPDGIIGNQVTVWGSVSNTNPVVTKFGSNDPTIKPYNLTLIGEAVAGSEEGTIVAVHGTLESSQTVRVTRAIRIKSWERKYSLYISLFAGIWVLVRFLLGWRLKVSTLEFLPRKQE